MRGDTFEVGKYHFLPPGGSWNLGGTHEFWKSKEGKRGIFGTLRGGGKKNFTDHIEKNKSSYYLISNRTLKISQ